MPLSENRFKAALKRGEVQIGFWQALASPYAAELCAGAGFDWLLLDGEHAPNDVQSLLAQLQAVAPYPVEAVVRPPIGDPVLIKQYLDIGVTTLLVPMVDTREQAEALVRAVRYPPHGMRGVGAAIARASRFGRIGDYLTTAEQQICLLVQIESVTGLANIDAIAAVEGVDGVFIGPADLAASMGLLGKSSDPKVGAALESALASIRQRGKAPGILMSDEAEAKRLIGLGYQFVAVGTDVGLFSRVTSDLAARFRA